MKTAMGKFVVFALAVLTIGVFAGHAQIVNQLEFKMSQPFTVANTNLPAGSYIIRPISETDQTVVEVSSASGKPSTMVDVQWIQPDATQGSSHLVLSQVFPGGGNQGYQLVEGHPEKLAAKTETPMKQTVASTAK